MSAEYGTLEELLTSYGERIASLERRADWRVLHGRVTDVDADKHVVRIQVGGSEQEPFKSPWLPYAQVAHGPQGLNIHHVPKTGTQMTMLSQGGDFRQALLLPFHWWNDHPSPSKDPDEAVWKWDKAKITMKADLVKLEVGDSVIEITEGHIHIHADEVVQSKAFWFGQDGKGEKAGAKADISDGIPAKQAWTIPG